MTLVTDPNKNAKKWFVFPDMIQGGKFLGFQNRDDETQSRGTFVVGQNVKLTDAMTPTMRDGYEPVGAEVADATPIRRAWVYETRGGDVYELKAYDTVVYYWLRGTSTEWVLLKGGFTADQDWAFANIGKSSESTNHCLMCNGTEGWYRFNGAKATITGGTLNTISIASGTWTALGFYTSGTRSVIINGTEYAYTGGEGTATLTGVTPDASGLVAGSLAVQSPQLVTTSLSGYTSNVAMSHLGRLHSRLQTKQDMWNYSDLDDPFVHTVGSSDTNGGDKEIEGGGGIVAFGKLNQQAIALKSRVIHTLEFTQYGSRIDAPFYKPLVSVDDKGSTLGATNQKSTFSIPLGLVFTTPDKQMMLLSGVTQNNQPQYTPLSANVQNIFNRGVHDTASGICFDNKIYYAFKEDKNSTSNDTVMVADLTGRSVSADGTVIPCVWFAPYVGWNVSDWTIVYNSTDKKHELHWHSSLNSGSFRMIDEKVDNTSSFTGIIRTHAELFDAPYYQKKIDSSFIEIKMLENSVVTATLLFDVDGYTMQKEYVLEGSRTNSLLQGAVYNPFGASAFGTQKFGSNEQQDQLKRYIFELEVNPNQRFYSLSLQLSSEDENSDFELVRYGYRVAEYIIETKRELKIAPN